MAHSRTSPPHTRDTLARPTLVKALDCSLQRFEAGRVARRIAATQLPAEPDARSVLQAVDCLVSQVTAAARPPRLRQSNEYRHLLRFQLESCVNRSSTAMASSSTTRSSRRSLNSRSGTAAPTMARPSCPDRVARQTR